MAANMKPENNDDLKGQNLVTKSDELLWELGHIIYWIWRRPEPAEALGVPRPEPKSQWKNL